MTEKPSYYAIIPADVRYSDIPANAKLLYGEITALANEKGYCWANNTYFANIYGVTNVCISKWISLLSKSGFIEIEIEKEEGNKRKIYVGKFNTSQTKVKEVLNKSLIPIKQKFKHNNIINNTSNNINISKDILIKFSQLKNFKKLKLDEWKDVNGNYIFSNEDFCKTIINFNDMRKIIKSPMTQNALELILKKASKYDVFYFIQMLEQSIERSWRGVFEINETKNENTKIVDEMQEKARKEAEDRKKRYENILNKN